MREGSGGSQRSGPRPRTPGIVYSAIALVLVVVISTITLSAVQPPPPTIAEFAPQAVEQIQDAPAEQSSTAGGAAGGADVGGAGGEVGVSVPEAVIEVPRVRRCVGDPPRQIEDPQSPPCVPYWQGDNGGATWRGVTRNEIIIAEPMSGGTTGGPPTTNGALLEAFFNRRFEFYGRKIKLVRWSNNATDQASLLASAEGIDKQLGAFASLPHASASGGGPFGGNREKIFADELARRGIINVYSGTGWNVDLTESSMAKLDPYQWAIQPGVEVIAANMAEWICRQLAGNAPAHAGPDTQALARDGKRTFGVLASVREQDNTQLDVEPLRKGLARCGASIAQTVRAGATDPDQAQAAMLSLKASGVTSVISFADAWGLAVNFMPAATNQAYHPEWILSSFAIQTSDSTGQLMPADQSAHMFGLQFLNKWNPVEDRPLRWALRESDPNALAPDASNPYPYWWNTMNTYLPLLLLASGIQMAGPNLTPETFRRALLRTTFPNPGFGAAPYYQAHVGFGATDHSLLDDAAIVWWNPSERSRETDNNQAGAFCYIGKGVRYPLGGWPSGQSTLFQGDCY